VIERVRTALLLVLAAGLFCECHPAGAQSALLNIPRQSQHARVVQRIGITDIAIDYSRPLARGRKVFGGLEPDGKVWRAGANENTTIEFTDAVTIEGQPLAKGIYGLHIIPNEDAWIMIFSRNATSWGSFSYDAGEDALRVTVKPQAIPHEEVLTYSFDDLTANSAVITLCWDTAAVPMKVEVDTPHIVEASLRNQLRGRIKFEWQAWQEAANYLLNNRLDPNEALQYANSSIDIEDHFENEITKSRALTALGRGSDAQAARDKAIAMGTQSQIHDYARVLLSSGQKDEAIEIFRRNIAKDPNTWIAHTEQARIAVARQDFDTAGKEIELAHAVAPEPIKSQLEALAGQVKNKIDINQ
jgi:hypothetical protein